LVILDEPTIGLDPSQIRSVRQLIKDLGRERTVLVSTHILSEVEMTCSRVLIMREGKILAADTPENLRRTMCKGDQTIAEIAAPREELQVCWDQMPEIDDYNISVTEGDYVRCALTAVDGMDLRSIVFDLVIKRGWKVRELSRTRHSLEDVYIRLTRPETEEDAL
jgi:ABC-2 type transport system ATP-binding protein